MVECIDLFKDVSGNMEQKLCNHCILVGETQSIFRHSLVCKSEGRDHTMILMRYSVGPPDKKCNFEGKSVLKDLTNTGKRKNTLRGMKRKKIDDITFAQPLKKNLFTLINNIVIPQIWES